MKKLIALIKNKPTQIVLATFFGVLCIAHSYEVASSRPPRWGGSGSVYQGPQFEPFTLALGAALLVFAFLTYRIWKADGLVNKDESRNQ
jgi:hypothetical protein